MTVWIPYNMKNHNNGKAEVGGEMSVDPPKLSSSQQLPESKSGTPSPPMAPKFKGAQT